MRTIVLAALSLLSSKRIDFTDMLQSLANVGILIWGLSFIKAITFFSEMLKNAQIDKTPNPYVKDYVKGNLKYIPREESLSSKNFHFTTIFTTKFYINSYY